MQLTSLQASFKNGTSVTIAVRLTSRGDDDLAFIPSTLLDRLPGRFYLVHGLRTLNDTKTKADARAVRQVVDKWLSHVAVETPIAFAQCNRRISHAYTRILPRFGWQVSPIIGSMAGDAPLVDKHYADGQDEQIIRLEKNGD